MRKVVRENALCALAAGAASFVVGWLGLSGFAWSDYEIEAKPAFDALTHGHVLEFLRLAPAYGGSLVERAPFALLPGLWGGGQLAVYRMVAVPCLLAGAAFAVWLCAQMRGAGRPALWRAAAVGVCVANPMTLQALELGHPEELLGACTCAAAVLVAARGRALWAGVLLGLAIANKEWALLAAGPVLLALPSSDPEPANLTRADSADTHARADAPHEHTLDTAHENTHSSPPRARADASAENIYSRRPAPLRDRLGRLPERARLTCLAAACATGAAVLAPLALAGSAFSTVVGRTAVTSTTASFPIFQPWQVWWFLGRHAGLVVQEGTPLPGYRVGPAWTGEIAHPLIIAAGLGAAALWLVSRRNTDTDSAGASSVSASDALLLLAVVLLARCVLDTWDTGYYMLPFSIALLTWETIGRRRAPILTLAGVIAPWLALAKLSPSLSPDGQAALFLVWTLPLMTGLALRLYAPGLADGLWRLANHRTPAADLPPPASGSPAQALTGGSPAQEMTVSSVGSPVSVS
jgi:hypothetical protein